MFIHFDKMHERDRDKTCGKMELTFSIFGWSSSLFKNRNRPDFQYFHTLLLLTFTEYWIM